MMEHRKEWLTLRCNSEEKYVFDYESDNGKELYFFVHPVRLQFFFGDRAFSGSKVQRFVLTGNLPISIEYSKRFIEDMSHVIVRDRIIYLQGIVEGESLSHLIKDGHISKYFKVLSRGQPYNRRLINLPDSFEKYMGSLPAKNRKDIKKSLKKFNDIYQHDFTLRKYRSSAEIDELFDALSAVSSRTYQARNLGLGLNKNSFIYKEFMEGAKLGYANCYILYVNKLPVAWRLGYCFDGVFYSHHVGYDPDYKKISPGVILHLLSIEDLINNQKEIHSIDLLYGDNDVKKKVSNVSRVESNYYLFPKNLRGYLNYFLMASFDSFIALISGFLTRFNLKDKLKYIMR